MWPLIERVYRRIQKTLLLLGIVTIPAALGFQAALYGLAFETWSDWPFIVMGISQTMALLAFGAWYDYQTELPPKSELQQSDEPDAQ